MRTTLASAVAAICLLANAAQAAPVGNPFLRGVKSPAELASKMETSLASDSTGRSIIDPERCKRDGSCARPADFLEMFQKSDPQAHLGTVWQVPGFLRTLQVAPAPQGEYWMACLKGSHPVLHCLSRRFKLGEKAWINPATHRVVLASDCTNPVEKEVKDKCVYIHFFTRSPDTVVRFALLGPYDVNDDCVGVKRAGESDFERWWTDECADKNCDFSGAVAVVGQPVRLAGSYVPAPGEHVLRLPAMVAEANSLFRTVLCLDRDGEHSDGVGVQWFDYSRVGQRTAYVWYDRSRVPQKATSRLTWTWGEW